MKTVYPQKIGGQTMVCSSTEQFNFEVPDRGCAISLRQFQQQHEQAAGDVAQQVAQTANVHAAVAVDRGLDTKHGLVTLATRHERLDVLLAIPMTHILLGK